MRGSRIATGLVALALGLAMPTAAHARSEAEQLRRLDIMLMVTGLRCRATRSDFRRDYQRFTSSHRATLSAAHRELSAKLTRRYGAAGARRAMDRMSVSMANSYGYGHPWLDCRELGQVARNLRKMKSRAELVHAANELLARRRSKRFALAGR